MSTRLALVRLRCHSSYQLVQPDLLCCYAVRAAILSLFDPLRQCSYTVAVFQPIIRWPGLELTYESVQTSETRLERVVEALIVSVCGKLEDNRILVYRVDSGQIDDMTV